MATLDSILQRVRLEIGDQATPFSSVRPGDGVTTRFELPGAPVDPTTLRVVVAPAAGGAGTVLTVGTGPGTYTLDPVEGVLTLADVPGETDVVAADGVAFKFFNDADMTLFVNTAVLQHLHNRSGVSLETLPPVEEYPVALLAAIEALYALLNDAAFDIDVSTPEGVGIPRSQRFRQLQEMIEARKEQYAQLCAALNVGLNRIEVFNLRRVSRTTGRLVPNYIPQELEDRQPPVRVFNPIDTYGGAPIDDPTPVLDLTMYEYGYFTEPITGLGDLTGWKVDARLRRYEDSSSIREFTVTVDDLVAGNITLDLIPTQTGQLPQRLYWDLRLTNRTTREVRTLRKGVVTVIQQVGVDESVGPVAGY